MTDEVWAEHPSCRGRRVNPDELTNLLTRLIVFGGTVYALYMFVNWLLS